MKVATIKTQVGIRELKNNLSRYLTDVKRGEEIVVTDRGNPIARLIAADEETDRLAALVSSGAITPPRSAGRRLPKRRVTAKGSVSTLVAEQRR